MEATYTPGTGVLVGAGRRWLLLAADPGPEVTEHLFSLLTGPRVETSSVLAAVADVEGLVLVDLTPGAETSQTRGSGRHTTSSGVHRLVLGEVPEHAGRRIVGGVVVGAGSVELRPAAMPTAVLPAVPAATAPAAASGGVLIDGIPDDILAAVAPDRLPEAARAVPVETDEPPAESHRRMADRMAERMAERMGSTVRRLETARGSDSDHDGHTTFRPEVPSFPPPPAPPGAHLDQRTAETVLAAHCPAGHVTAAFTPRCRVCGEKVPPQEPQRITRPRLGVLHLPDGERVPLDRGVLLGRQPTAEPGSVAWPHLVRLPPGTTYVSRTHLSVELDGWLVLATDLGSRGGTTLRVPGRPPQRIRAHERYVWEPGQVLDLADSYEVVYEVTP